MSEGQLDIRSLVDLDRGAISASVFTDPGIYELELERVFKRSWLFLTHESTIPKRGDYVGASMGEDPVLVIRRRDGGLTALLNQCRHRGMKICRADAGNARAFTCTYHGWTYDLEGNLVNVPFEERAYRGGLDKSRLGAHRVPRVESYRGLVFGNWDPDAPPFEEYLGDMAWYLDSLADRFERTEFIKGVTKWVIECNWKLPAEQFASDTYHAESTHVSALMAQGAGPDDGGWDSEMPGAQFSSDRGHGGGFFLTDQEDFSEYGPATKRYLEGSRETVVDRLGEMRAINVRGHNTVFPNFSYLCGTNTLRVWNPRGPGAVEVWAWTLVDADAPEDAKEGWRLGTLRTFSPAGTFEQDDGENWAEIQQVLRGRVARDTMLNYSMGLGLAGDHPDLPGRIGDVYSEEAARGFYRYWAELMETPVEDRSSEPVA